MDEAMRKAVRRMEIALEMYADSRNWRNDDWNVPSIFEPEYGNPGKKAQDALKAYRKALSTVSGAAE